MSVVIVGGNECMKRVYQETCAQYGYHTKVYTRRHKDLARVFGCPDLCVLFTSTVSHTMVKIACEAAKKRNVPLVRSHVSSIAALDALLKDHCQGQ